MNVINRRELRCLTVAEERVCGIEQEFTRRIMKNRLMVQGKDTRMQSKYYAHRKTRFPSVSVERSRVHA